MGGMRGTSSSTCGFLISGADGRAHATGIGVGGTLTQKPGPGFFGFLMKEAQVLVPEQRLVLRTGYQALIDADLADSLPGSSISTYVGDCANESATYCPTLDACRQTSITSAATAARIAHLFGLRGGACSFDTACSSSLVALGHAHTQMQIASLHKEIRASRKPNGALVVGVRVLFGPEGFIGLGAAGFLSIHGRCLTFDGSAHGFGRGEGCCAVFLAADHEEQDVELHLASLSGSHVNQDGRSASLTAPHGPSQQSCIRGSLRMAKVSPDAVAVAECHGTGTSLGDPIEVGALCGIMDACRRAPLMMTSSKSNIGHAESAAGLNGLAKCILMLMTSASAPNVHLRSLNPNLDTAGFPCLYETECVDASENSQNVGVSSFGFGGTNARADLWGHCQQGPRSDLLVSSD